MEQQNMAVRLTGPQRGELATTLINAFTPSQFRQMLQYRLNRNLDRLAPPGDYDSVMYEVLEKAVAQWWVADLLVAAREENPGAPDLAVFAARFGVGVAQPDAEVLEHVIRKTNSFLDVAMWRSRLGEIEARVCRVEIPVQTATVFGTGFLVGPGCVITNYHVVEAVIQKKASPSDIGLRFDYKVVAGKIEAGRVYRVAAGEQWLIDSARYSDFDLVSYTPLSLPSDEELDYAVIRLADRVGEQPIGSGAPGALARGWVSMTDSPRAPEVNGTMHILQHPNGAPMKLALGSEAVIGLNPNGTRVRYTTNTEGGSSGSPCFDENWNLLALHHSGDPRFPQLSRAEYNQGIPIGKIAERLKRRGKIGQLLA